MQNCTLARIDILGLVLLSVSVGCVYSADAQENQRYAGVSLRMSGSRSRLVSPSRRFWMLRQNLACVPAAALALLFGGRPIQARLVAQERALGDEARNSVTVAGAGTFADGSIEGDAFDRHLYLLGVRYGRLLARTRTLTFGYALETVPAAWVSQPVRGQRHDATQRSMPPFTHTETTYGAGASPVGFELGFMPRGRVQPLVATDEGFLYFGRNIPSRSAAQFNFTLDVRVGVQIHLKSERDLRLEYVYHHLSNGYSAQQNPGMDSQMVCVGYGRRFRF